MWPPDCVGRHLAHPRDTSQEAPERFLGPTTAALPPLNCCVLGIPCLGWKGSKISTGLSSVGTSSPGSGHSLHPSPAGLAAAAQPCGLQDSFLPLRGLLALLGLCVLGNIGLPKNLQNYWEPPTFPSFAQSHHPSHSLWCLGRDAVGALPCPALLPAPGRMGKVPDTLRDTQEGFMGVTASPRV